MSASELISDVRKNQKIVASANARELVSDGHKGRPRASSIIDFIFAYKLRFPGGVGTTISIRYGQVGLPALLPLGLPGSVLTYLEPETAAQC